MSGLNSLPKGGDVPFMPNTGLRGGKIDVVRLQNAIELYRGDFLLESVYETWAAEQREQLAALWTIVFILATHYLEITR